MQDSKMEDFFFRLEVMLSSEESTLFMCTCIAEFKTNDNAYLKEN